MTNPTAKAAVQTVEKIQSVKGAVLARPGISKVLPLADQIPLTVRTRKVVRLAPPVDTGFRPFRIF